MRVLLIDENFEYIQRLTRWLQQNNGGRYDIYSVTNIEQAADRIRGIHPEAVVVDKAVADHHPELASHASAYFVNDANIEQIDGKMALCKFRNMELIHQDILTVLAEGNTGIIIRPGSGNCDITVFTSPAGGTGCTSLACAYAINRTRAGKKTLFLSLDPYGNTDVYFRGIGTKGMTDLIYAIKSRNNNFPIRIEACLKRTVEGVMFFGKSKNALDMLEMTADDQQFLLSGLKSSGLFDCIVMDLPFGMDKDFFKMTEDARGVLWVNDGRPGSADKIDRAYEAFSIKGAKENSFDVTGVVNNKYSENTGYCFPEKMPEYGTVPKIEEESSRLELLSETSLFEEIG